MPKVVDAGSNAFAVSERNRVRRLHERGRYDRASIYPILDAAMICHIAYVIDGQPYCTPTAFWREGDHLYWHGSSASRMLRSQRSGLPVCLTVTHLDSLALARCGFNHSVDYHRYRIEGCTTWRSHAGTDDPIAGRPKGSCGSRLPTGRPTEQLASRGRISPA